METNLSQYIFVQKVQCKRRIYNNTIIETILRFRNHRPEFICIIVFSDFLFLNHEYFIM